MFVTPLAVLTRRRPGRFLGFLALPLWLAISTHACAQSARIAVIGDPSLGELIDVTTAQLSAVPGVSVLERSDLDKLGQEKALQAVMGSNDFSAVQLLPADGLVILRAVKQNGKTGVFARLVAVQPGIVLRDVALSDGGDSVAHAGEIVKEFGPSWFKLTEIQKGKITALSLLGLRFEVDGPQARELERRINVLLASRLSAEPDTVVLERWRLNDALFDKSLNSQPPAPFWTGSSLIDGSMTLANKEITVNLRVRPPQGVEVSIADKDAVDNLPALVARLADKIQAHPMLAGTWQPAAEAEHFAGLGKWCLDNGLYDQGVEAIESALALGDDSPATHRLQIRAFRMLTFPEELSDAGRADLPMPEAATPEAMAAWVDSGTLAANATAVYLATNSAFTSQSGAPDDPAALSVPVLNSCLRVLRFDYQIGYFKNHGDETAALRHAVQNLISEMEPLLAKSPPDLHDHFITYTVRYAPYWHETPELTIDYYREMLNRKTDGAVIRTELFNAFYLFLHPPCMLPEAEEQAAHPDRDAGIMLGNCYDSVPRILSWDDSPLSELTPIWDHFLQELKTSADPVQQADGMKFTLSSYGPGYFGSEDPGSPQFVAFLEGNQESICGPRSNDFLIGFHRTVQSITYATDHSDRDRLRVLGEALLKKQAVLSTEWIKWMPEIYHGLPSDEAGPLLASLDVYRQWYQQQTPQDAGMVQALDQARRPLAIYAGTGVAGGKEDFLIVNQHWPVAPNEAASGEERRALPFGPGLTTAENKIWFAVSGGTHILCVDPSNLQTLATYVVPDQFTHFDRNSPADSWLGVTPHDLVVTLYGRVVLCSRDDNTWRQLELPPSDYRPYWLDQQLYLTYDTEAEFKFYRGKDQTAGAAISGLIRVSLPDGAIDNLVSTRRIPPQSPLDGKPLGYPTDLWSSPSGLRMAVDADSPHFQVFAATVGKNDWTLGTTDPMWCEVKVDEGKALVGKGVDDYGFAQIVLMNGTVGEVLLSNPNRVPDDGSRAARWNIPDEIREAPQGVIWQASPAMRGDDLCLYRNEVKATGESIDAALYYFTNGEKSGVKIPLKFQTNVTNPTLVKASSWINDYRSLQVTDYGLVLVQRLGGFWVIPWKDIDAYRARVAAGGNASLPMVAAPSTTP